MTTTKLETEYRETVKELLQTSKELERLQKKVYRLAMKTSPAREDIDRAVRSCRIASAVLELIATEFTEDK
jgi:hypothetical protein